MTLATIPRVAASRRKTQPFSLDASVILRPSLTNEIDEVLGIAAPTDQTVVLLYQRYARATATRVSKKAVVTMLVAVGLATSMVLASVGSLMVRHEGVVLAP
jgi:hypothetical protein